MVCILLLKLFAIVTMQASTALQSDAMFRVVEEHVKSMPGVQKNINALYLFDITVNGKNAAHWSMNLFITFYGEICDKWGI